MDKLYIGDIPQDYVYADFNVNYIDLYNKRYPNNGDSLTYYRIYTNYKGFYYSTNNRQFGYNTNVEFVPINTTNNILYRNDIDSIFVCTFIIAIFGIFLINIVTSIVKSHGLLGGLL